MKKKPLVMDMIISGFLGTGMGGVTGVIGFAMSYFMPWLSMSQRGAIIPASVVIGFILGICTVFLRGK